MIGAALGGFALAWLAALVMTRPAVLRDCDARIAALAAGGFALVLVDDPRFLTLLLFAIAVSLATLLPRRRFDDAIAWAGRLVWHGVSGLSAPLRDLGKIGRVRERRRYQGLRLTGMISLVALPIVGGALFLTLFANANPLIANAFSGKFWMYSDWLGCARWSSAALVLATVVVAMVYFSGVGEKLSWWLSNVLYTASNA